MTTRAIETQYAGCRFRSRLEARYAVLFDHLQIPWQYEPEGFHVGPTDTMYLPDFYLPTSNTWCEVKPSREHVDWNILEAMDFGQGLPGMHESLYTTRGLALLFDIPNPRDGYEVGVPILQHHKGLWWTFATWSINHGLEPRGAVESFDRAKPISEFVVKARNARVLEAYAAARSARFEHGDREQW